MQDMIEVLMLSVHHNHFDLFRWDIHLQAYLGHRTSFIYGQLQSFYRVITRDMSP